MSVCLTAVEKSFKGVAAVDGVTLDIPSGSFFSIIGASGCGKTTTLRMIAGFERPDTGTVEVEGEDVTGLPAHRRPVNTVFQTYALFPHLDVFENVAFGLREARRPKDEIASRVSGMIELVQLTGRERAKPRQLSGGQQQRVALARALVNRPKVLLLDEPLGALDLRLRREMQGELKRIQNELGITFVYVTHDQDEAFSMSDAVAVMDRGRIEQVGGPAEIYHHPATTFVAEFVGAANHFQGHALAETAPGRYRVELADGTRVVCSGPAGALQEGVEVTVIVRPEDLVVGGEPADCATVFAGQVADATFLGASRSLRVRTEGDRELNAVTHGYSDDLRPGDQVRLTWPDEAAWAIGSRRTQSNGGPE
jgi:spermidine/putrescine transport system ATP-binding protein